MQVIPGEVIIEPAGNRPAPKSQPIEALSNPEPLMDESQVRRAISNAVENNQDPQSITMQDFAQVPTQNPVPQKFLKTDGTVDVDKIQTSTRQLDEAIQNKQALVQKSVDDYLEMERKFRSMPNADKLVAQAPQIVQASPAQMPQGQLTPQQQEEIVRRDYAADPLGTTTRLLDLMLQAKFQPIEERNQIEQRRSNIQKIAEKDPRVLQEDIFNAVNAKLQSDPDLWKLKNPHKAAWLEVKEEMRLGEPSQVQTQPSRSTPVLGGGSPPSVPSSSVQSSGAVDFSKLDIRDRKQEAMGDDAIRAMLNRR